MWDLKGNRYLDMFCAVGTSILECNIKIKSSVMKLLKREIASLNCPGEVFLARQIVKHHPWASMAKFTRGGGE